MPSTPLGPVGATTLLAFWLSAPNAVAQHPSTGAATISGVVLSDPGGIPVSGAVVALRELDPEPHRVSGGWITTVTNGAGRYEISVPGPGTYTITVKRIGHFPTSVQVSIGDPTPVRLSMVMEVHPVRLRPLRIAAVAPRSNWLAPPASAPTANERLDHEMARQQLMLSSDSRALTGADLVESVTLGATDILRAVVDGPGIESQSDWTTAPRIRGAPWDHTRVNFDGMPIFNALHTFGLLSAINADAVGVVTVQPGVRPATWGEGAAGIVDVRSQSPRTRDGWASASLSQFQASFATSSSPSPRTGVLLTARVGSIGLYDGVPYLFSDVIARGDVVLPGNVTLDASLFRATDRLAERGPSESRESSAQWDNFVWRASVRVPTGTHTLNHTVGGSEFGALVHRTPSSTTLSASDGPFLPTDNTVRQFTVRTSLEPRERDRRDWWAGGVEFTGQETQNIGTPSAPFALQTLFDSLGYRSRTTRVTGWLTRRWRPHARLTVETGARVAVGESPRGANAVRVSPRVNTQVRLATGTILSVAFGRHWQYAQALAGTGAIIGPGLEVSQVWLLAGDSIPALRSDIVTGGIERWFGTDWLGSLTLYRRYTSGMTISDPRPGFVPDRLMWVEARGHSRGFDASLRRLSGQWTGSASYSLSGSTYEAMSMQFASPADRRHVIDASVLTTLDRDIFGGHLRIGASSTIASGAPYTRRHPCQSPCSFAGTGTGELTPVPSLARVRSGDNETLPEHRTSTEWVGHPNELRGPALWSMDIVLDWQRQVGRIRFNAYLQLRNLFARHNAVTYVRGGSAGCAFPAASVRTATGDCFERGMPTRPLVGLRITF